MRMLSGAVIPRRARFPVTAINSTVTPTSGNKIFSFSLRVRTNTIEASFPTNYILVEPRSHGSCELDSGASRELATHAILHVKPPFDRPPCRHNALRLLTRERRLSACRVG